MSSSPKCYNCYITAKPGDDKTLIFQWLCDTDKKGYYPGRVLDCFEIIPYYLANKSKSWIPGSKVQMRSPSKASGGYWVYEYKRPALSTARWVYFQVCAKPDKNNQWVDTWASSDACAVPAWEAANNKYYTATTNANSNISSANNDESKAAEYRSKADSASQTTSAQMIAKANLYGDSAKKWADAAAKWDYIASEYARAISAGTEIGYDVSSIETARESALNKKTADLNEQKAAEKKRDDLLKQADKKAAEEAKKKERDAMVGRAVEYYNKAVDNVTSANVRFKSREYSTASALYKTAASNFERAAYWWGEAVAYASDDDDKRTINQKKTTANQYKADYTAKANTCDGYIQAASELEEQRSAKPASPSVSYTQSSANIRLNISCSAVWTTELRIYRDVNGEGKWPLVHTIYRVLPTAYNDSTGKVEPVGSAWTPQTWYDRDMADGKSYRYYVKSVTPSGKASDSSGTSQSYSTKPSRPENLALQLVGYDNDGKANIRVTWKNTSNVATEIQVQYSTWYSGGNAWDMNALDKITTKKASAPNATSFTITGVSPVKTLYVRVYAVNGQGGAWAYTAGGKEKNLATATISVPSSPVPALNVPTALKAAVASGIASSVTLTWTDKQEQGATYAIEYSANSRAWDLNAVGDITKEEWSGTGQGESSSSTKTYTVTRLASGKKYFRVYKKKEKQGVYAKAAGGGSKHDALTCVVDVPVEPVPTIPVPTKFTAAKASDTSVLLTWEDASQARTDSYEVQAADYASAFTDNATGDIQSYSVDEVTSVKAKKYTATSLDRGRTWYFRVRKKTSDGVSPWSTTKSVKLPGETIRKPTGLKVAEVSGDPTRINVTWADAPEDGVSYIMRIAPSLRAFQNNAISEIVEQEYVPSTSTSDIVCQYEFVNLTPGTTYYIQAVKVKGDLREQARAASGGTKADTYTAYLQLPEDPVQSVSVPSDVTAVPRTSAGELVLEGDGTLAASQVSWTDAQGSNESYEVQYTDDSEAFADNALGYIQSLEFEGSGGQSHTVAVTGLERGKTWYFRVRKKAQDGQGDWSTTATCMIDAEEEAAEELAPPTTVDTLGGYAVDEEIVLAWTHNSAQSSDQSGYQVEITVTKPGGNPLSRVVEAAHPTTNNVYRVDAVDWGLEGDGTKVEWRVRTSGVQFQAYSPWSRTQSFKVFARPVAVVSVDDSVQSFPVDIDITAITSGGGTLSDENSPIQYTVEVVAGEAFDYEGPDGGKLHVAEGEVVFTRSTDSRDEEFDPTGWTCSIEALDVRLVVGVLYIARGTVMTAQGMRDSMDAAFRLDWDDSSLVPMCEAYPDMDSLTMTILPFCGTEEDTSGDSGTEESPEIIVPTEDEVAASHEWQETGLYMDYTVGYVDTPASEAMVGTVIDSLRENTVLSVYRVTPSGPVEIASNLPNDGMTSCLDPHPDFGTVTYRVVAVDILTGAQSSNDMTFQMPIDKIVVQWDEQWMEGGVESLYAAYSGNIIQLERNKQTSEQYAQDVALREYAGRAHPVSYYGTQKGQKSRLNAVIVKGYEAETLEGVRQLAAWPGNCYVREPLGTGYWASVNVGVSSKNRTAAIEVSLDVTRVEGGK